MKYGFLIRVIKLGTTKANVQNNAQHGKRLLCHMQTAKVRISMQSDLNILCLSTYTTSIL